VAAVKAPDELSALGLDCDPRRPKFLVIRAKEDYERLFTTEDRALQPGRRFGKSAKKCGHYGDIGPALVPMDRELSEVLDIAREGVMPPLSPKTTSDDGQT